MYVDGHNEVQYLRKRLIVFNLPLVDILPPSFPFRLLYRSLISVLNAQHNIIINSLVFLQRSALLDISYF